MTLECTCTETSLKGFSLQEPPSLYLNLMTKNHGFQIPNNVSLQSIEHGGVQKKSGTSTIKIHWLIMIYHRTCRFPIHWARGSHGVQWALPLAPATGPQCRRTDGVNGRTGQRMLRAGCLGLGYNRWLRPKMEGLTQNLAISSFSGTHDEKTIENIGIWGLSAQVSEAAMSSQVSASRQLPASLVGALGCPQRPGG